MAETAVGGTGQGVRLRDVSKVFPGVRALDRASLTIEPGEIHSLVGGNGSGKSTLIKILVGVESGEPGGAISVNGHEVRADEVTPEFARSAGIHVVHQDLGVFPDLSVAENLALGYGYSTTPLGNVRWRTLRAEAASLIERFDIRATPEASLRSLTRANQTLVAIARALREGIDGHLKLLILDEPTASLPAREVSFLLSTLRRYAERGCGVLYVSHRFKEVLDISDRVTVLRDGQTTGTYDADELDDERLVNLVVGRSLDRNSRGRHVADAPEERVSITGLTAGPLRDFDLSVARGEIVGIAGLLGSGRSTLLRCLFGDVPRTAGRVVLDGEEIRFRNITEAIAAGVAYVPENRLEDAVFEDFSVNANLAAPRLRAFSDKGLLMRDRKLRLDARRLMKEFLIKAPDETVAMSALSGGNQQKVVVARWLAGNPRLLLLDEPTQGVDVGARIEIYSLIRDAARAGASVLVVESDLEELARVVDRAIVLRDGEIVGELRAPDISAAQLTHMSQFQHSARSTRT